MCHPFFECVATRTHTLLFLARWVARSSVGSRVARRLPGRHSSVTASPLRCRTGLSVGRRGSGRAAPWCPQGGLLPAGTCWTRLQSSKWGDRVMTAQQKDIGSGLGSHRAHSPEGGTLRSQHTPRQPTPRLPGQLLCDYHRSLARWSWDGGLAGSHSRTVRRVVG